jgi:hypothetical protein
MIAFKESFCGFLVEEPGPQEDKKHSAGNQPMYASRRQRSFIPLKDS